MAPKALTDCPENLREAIDWLIQVKHCGGVSTVSDALSTLFDNVAQDAEKSQPSLLDSDRPSARDVVSKLRAFQSTLPKDSENPNKNIIHNLCTSAASLLGYRSPGTYDGSGIVYGNASRLCDAILAFLYAVFSDVYGSQPYVAGRSVLHDVVVELKSQLWRGHKGFCEAIPRVANGLHRYNAAVTASNEKVKKPIETVLDYVKTDGELHKGIQALQITETSTSTQDERTVESAVSLVEGCKEVARVFSKSLTAAKDAINDLNPKLRRKLENARKSFFNHVDWLSKLSKKGQKMRLDNMIQKIKTRLKRLANAVKDKIKQEVHTVVELLKDRVREIKMKLEGITASLEEYVKELGQWMGDAKKYIKDVKKHVDDIMKQLDGDNKKKIDQAAADIDKTLSKKVAELNEWIKEAEIAVNVAKDRAEDVYRRLNKDDKDQKISQGIEKITKAKEAVSGVSTQLHTVHDDLSKWKTAVQGVLSKAAAKAGEVSDKLDPDRAYSIAQNLNQIHTSNEAINIANEQLKTQVDKLNTWITDADRIREQAQKKAQDVYNSLKVHEELSKQIGEIHTANKEIQNVNSGLGEVDNKLGQWSQEAERVIQAVVDKATAIHKKLNTNYEYEAIAQAIVQITATKENVEEVAKGLKNINDDLEKWREAAHTVLDIAVSNAEKVRDKLDPTKNDVNNPIGQKIKDIGDAKQELDNANRQLKIQVENLRKWIQSAEDIRHKAEQKAREAYDKLNVHEKLSENVKRIVDAKEKIDGVHTAVATKVKELGTWNSEAEKVISGAITNAQYVHDRLQSEVGPKIEEIERDNKEIGSASKRLEDELKSLTEWQITSGKVIKMAEDKCDEILKKVDINHEDHKGGKTGPVIFKQAKELQDKGTKLLKAAQDAKRKVEEKVKSALEAVKNMDTDFKRDLKVVKDEIMKGIEDVIKKLKVGELGEEVQKDLKELRGRIVNLKAEINKKENNGGSLVKKELDVLDKAKNTLTEESRKIKEQKLKEMDQRFNSAIKEPLKSAVEKVTMEIGKLYTTVGGKEQNTKGINDVIGHIKGQVGNILNGEEGKKDRGLEGIANGLVESYAGGFNNFGRIVKGWIEESILRYNGVVREKMDWKIQLDNSKFTEVANEVKSKLSEEIGKGKNVLNGGSKDTGRKITKTLTKVKEACEEFADALDGKTLEDVRGEVTGIVNRIQQVKELNVNGTQNSLSRAEAVLCALSTASRQVSKEIDSIMLGDYRVGKGPKVNQTSIAQELDRVLEVTKNLDGKLGEATKPSDPGTAQAVDKAIGDVKTEVNEKIAENFNMQVRKPVEDAFNQLDTAVKTFDEAATKQVKEAAKGAIEQAAKQISVNGSNTLIDLSQKMPNFHNAHNEVTNKLRPQLEKLLNDHIGSDDTAGQNDEKVKLSDNFKNYKMHMDQPVNPSKGPEGKLPGAIKEIQTEGLAALNQHIDGTINEKTFEDPFKQIAGELEGITKLVSQNGGLGNKDKGVKNLLQDLRTGLDSGTLDGTSDKGLKNIQSGIDGLLKGTFVPKPAEISKAVDEIRKEVEVLKKMLLDKKGSDVITALKDLQTQGLKSENGWNGTVGLGKIHKNLQEQNGKLPEQANIIGESINKIKKEMQDVLREVGLKLDHYVIPHGDEILYNLRRLEDMIGLGENNNTRNLQNTTMDIGKLGNQEFSTKPGEIERAAGVIRRELGVLHHKLHKDLIDAIKDLQENGLGAGEWEKVGHRRGLKNIEGSLNSQIKLLSHQPENINVGVEQIINELDILRNKLQNPNGNRKDDVINTLEYLMRKGLGEGGWQNGKNGLRRIKNDLQGQNEQLSAASGRIEQATNRVLSETEDMLKNVQQKLGPELVPYDTITSYLRHLQEKIGKENANGESLQGIQQYISRLQDSAFKNNPSEIVQAKQNIEEGLKAQRKIIQEEVSNLLTDLVTNGFGNSDKWNGHNATGFDHIQDNIKTQNNTLSQQPGQIESGIKDITDELGEVRTELQGTTSDDPQGRGVINNLEFMIQQIGNKDNEGLKNIKTQMDSLKKNQVPVITQNLNSMSLNITNAAAQVGLNLNQLDTPHIDVKLKGIETGLDKLRLTDLAAAIKLCDDFLIKAEEIENNTIDALWKHVDYEVDDAIKDLTKEARVLYVDSVREALELFGRKANEDLKQLPGDINHDLTIGFKGFMNAVEGDKGVNIKQLTSVVSKELKHLSAAFAGFFGEVNEYVRNETERVYDEQNKKNPSLPPTDDPYAPKLNEVYKALTELLVYFRDNVGVTDRLTELVERLTKALGNLVPSDFKHPSTPLLDTVARGLTTFAGEFGNCYISAYSGQRCREEHAHKYAKVLLSVIPMTHEALNKLMVKCESDWKHLHITQFTADDRDNPLGNYFTRCGYRVSSNESGQDGELNNMFTGGGIYELLATPMEDVAIEMLVEGQPVKNGINLVTMVAFLYNTVCHYYQACHIYVPPDPRYPCTVRDMLSWISGLQYTLVAYKLPGHCKALLNRRCHDGDIPNREDKVMAKCIGELPYTIARTCLRSTALLTAIQGNGHGFDLAAYPYSVDFSNNRAGLHYPADPGALLDMLREIVCRLCKVLYFLYSQCCRSTARVKGWRECAYGRQVQSHHWQCNNLGRGSTTTTTTTTTTSFTAKHGCPPTSPLQSFLSDSCHGLLPHTLGAADMVIECANCTANQLGQQCLTPLGFWDLGFAASITGTGWDIAKRLGDMCHNADSCLFVLCRTLFLLCPTAPSSLSDVFSLYTQLLRIWDPYDHVKHRGGTYTDASNFISHLNTDGIDGLFPLWKELHGSYENSKLTSAIASLAGHDHKSHDALSSLFHHSTCQSPRGCAPYIQPLGLHAHHTYPQKHAGLYITWIIYLAWEFWELLYQLLQALDNINCTASGCATCPCQPGTHGGKDTCHCPSIVQCAGPLPTLYRYGFTYRNANLLVAANRTMRCGDLNAQLKQALQSEHFTDLFRQIDQLIWQIRKPFLYFLIALWSLIALYILHTFLYRMDVLHIRSHLIRTKASHLIDVKALLTKGRKMLSLYDASYFDEDPSELLDTT